MAAIVSLNKKKAALLLKTVATDRTFINIGLPGVEHSYRTRLLALGERDGEASLFLAPLEPANGNMKIRTVRGEDAVAISFVAKNQTYQGKVTFFDASVSNGHQVLRLSLPNKLEPTAKIRRREENRVKIPDHVDLTLVLGIKGQKKIDGIVEDLSSGGLSFSCPKLAQTLVDGNRTALVIGGSLLKGESINISGIVRRCVVLRHGREARDHYGIQFQRISPAAAMAVDRLVRLRIPDSDDAWFMTEQTRFKSGM